jgi:hypothetical protein
VVREDHVNKLLALAFSLSLLGCHTISGPVIVPGSERDATWESCGDRWWRCQGSGPIRKVCWKYVGPAPFVFWEHTLDCWWERVAAPVPYHEPKS